MNKEEDENKRQIEGMYKNNWQGYSWTKDMEKLNEDEVKEDKEKGKLVGKDGNEKQESDRYLVR